MVCPWSDSGNTIRKGYDRRRQKIYCKEQVFHKEGKTQKEIY